MRIHEFGDKENPLIIMLPGSFCNADTMDNIIQVIKEDLHVLAVDYNGQYENSEKEFSSREGEAKEIIQYLNENNINQVDLVYGQSMGGEMGMELVSQLFQNGFIVKSAFFDGGPFLKFPSFVSKFLGRKFKSIIGNLRGKTLDDALKDPTIVKFSGGKPERYANLLGPICQNAEFISDISLEREADACVTFDYPEMSDDFQKNIYFFYSKEESAYKFAKRKLKKAYPHANFKLVEAYGHVGYPAEHLEEYSNWLIAIAKGNKPF